MDIRKLRVVRVNKVFVIVEDGSQLGSIHISEVGNYFIKNLQEVFKPDDILYGDLINEEKKYYSLKVGHSIPKAWLERGGGFLGLQNYLEKFKGESND